MAFLIDLSSFFDALFVCFPFHFPPVYLERSSGNRSHVEWAAQRHEQSSHPHQQRRKKKVVNAKQNPRCFQLAAPILVTFFLHADLRRKERKGEGGKSIDT